MDSNRPKFPVNNSARSKMGITNIHITDLRDLNIILVRGAGTNSDSSVDLQIEQSLENIG